MLSHIWGIFSSFFFSSFVLPQREKESENESESERKRERLYKARKESDRWVSRLGEKMKILDLAWHWVLAGEDGRG